MKIEKTDCSYQVTECDLKFGKQIALDGELLIPASVLNKISAEIQKEGNIWYHDCEADFSKKFDVIRVDTVLSIIDKYRESEEA